MKDDSKSLVSELHPENSVWIFCVNILHDSLIFDDQISDFKISDFIGY